MKKLIIGLMLAVSVWASGLERPVLGFVMDARGALHGVEGIAGAFVVGAVVEDASAYAPAVGLTLERRDAGFFVVDGDGGVVEILPPEAVCAVLMERGSVFATGDEVVVGDVRLALPGVTALRAVSAEFVQASAESGEYLVRIERGRESAFVLPVIPVESVAEVEE